jgi:uncharacterized protein YndB with AHSA1/START domain
MTTTIVRDVLIHSSADRVWAALTAADQIPAWFCDGARFDPRPGGEVEWRWAHGPQPYVGRATVKELVANKKLVLSGGKECCWPDTTITFALAADGPATLLTLTHAGPAASLSGEVGATWTRNLDILKYFAETGQIPVKTWDVARIQQRVLSDKGAVMGAVFGFVIGKLGPEAAAEIHPLMIKAHAQWYRSHGLESPLHFAQLYAQEHLNVYGERMFVSGTASRAVIERRDRSQYDALQSGGFPGDYAAFLASSAQYASGLIKELGYHPETEIGSHGYRLVIKK